MMIIIQQITMNVQSTMVGVIRYVLTLLWDRSVNVMKDTVWIVMDLAA